MLQLLARTVVPQQGNWFSGLPLNFIFVLHLLKTLCHNLQQKNKTWESSRMSRRAILQSQIHSISYNEKSPYPQISYVSQFQNPNYCRISFLVKVLVCQSTYQVVFRKFDQVNKFAKHFSKLNWDSPPMKQKDKPKQNEPVRRSLNHIWMHHMKCYVLERTHVDVSFLSFFSCISMLLYQSRYISLTEFLPWHDHPQAEFGMSSSQKKVFSSEDLTNKLKSFEM